MYIACKNCHTTFIVNSNQIGKDGRRVKCSKCLNIWHQKSLPNIESNKEYTKPQDDSVGEILRPVFGEEIHLPIPFAAKPKAYNSFTFLLIIIIISLSYLLML